MTTAPTTPRLADDRQRGGHSPAMLGSGVRPVIHASLGNCGDEVPHVYDTTVMPPHPDKRCRCGKQTWRKSEIEMLELRLKTFAAAQPPKDRLETVGLDASEGVSAAPPRVSNTTSDELRHSNVEASEPPTCGVASAECANGGSLR